MTRAADEPDGADYVLRRRAVFGCPSFPVAISRRPYPIPSRTRKSSFSEPMVLHGQPCGRVGRCRVNSSKAPRKLGAFVFLFVPCCRELPGFDRHMKPCSARQLCFCFVVRWLRGPFVDRSLKSDRACTGNVLLLSGLRSGS